MNGISFRKQALGFTLVELISVLVILGIVAAIGSNFLVTAIDSYNKVEKRAKLISRGRLAIEQMTRQLRIALPNAIRISSSKNCIEFMPIVGGANYMGFVPDAENGAADVNSISTSAFSLGLGNAVHVSISPFSAGEVYTTAKPSSRVAIGSLGTEPYENVPLALSHQFLRNSINRRLFVTDKPKRFCLASGNLVEYADYNFPTTPLTDAAPGVLPDLIATGVSTSGVAFELSPGSEVRNTAINIDLTFSDRGETVSLKNTVLVRNVP